MVRKARVWFDGDLLWNSDDAEGGVAVQTPSALVFALCAAGESLPVDDGADEPEPLPPKPVPKNREKTKRHLAGANWLNDWTLYRPRRDESVDR